MHFGLQIQNEPGDYEIIRAVISAVDRGRWHSVWGMDHLLRPLAELMPHVAGDVAEYEAGPVHEGWALLAAWAASTSRVRLGALVSAVTFRNPALLAKMAATIDHISKGRFELGIGAAWHQREHQAYGFELGTVKQRLDRLEEALQVITKLFSGPGPHDFAGQYFKLEKAPFSPPTYQSHLPILVGGTGEKRTLRMAAQYADRVNVFGNLFGSKEDVVRKLQILDEHCAAVGRDSKAIDRTISLFATVVENEAEAARTRAFIGQNLDQRQQDNLLIGSPQRIIEGVAQYLELGASEIIFMGIPPTVEAIQNFDENVLRAFARTPVAAR